ncbi:carbon-nitrogen hydrolase family protein [Mycoplasma sp. P36-A1]|uniref:carbon-nitrogen hydrolase family protein n=1 Tax=Mycoplasma sp. P36-A1 TaxID=3252900 RepID=UPI003C2DBC95
MKRFLNIGIIQLSLSENATMNFINLEKEVEYLMSGNPKPELIIGPELIQGLVPDYIPGLQTAFFAKIAQKHGIYFIPGSIMEKSDELAKGKFYNSAPIFNPKGELIDVYRKIMPYGPTESNTIPGNKYVVFDIVEKNTKIGVQICYDMNFPEISRNEVLLGAEVLVKLTLDPVQLYNINKYVPIVRALENQAYFISTQSVGTYLGSHLCGHSTVVNPEGEVLWQASNTPVSICLVLDLDAVSLARNYGTLFTDHYLQHLRDFDIPMPFSDNIKAAPVFDNIIKTPLNVKENDAIQNDIGIGCIGKRYNVFRDINTKSLKQELDSFLNNK